MELFYRAQEGIDQCICSQRFTISHLKPGIKTLKIHVHDCYEIYYSIAGGKEFFIGDQYYDIRPHDVFFIRPNENHHITQLDDIKHDRINIAIHPRFMERYSTPDTSLAGCFTVPDSRALNLSPEYQKRFEYLIQKINKADGFGSDLLEDLYLCEGLIMLSNCLVNPDARYRPRNDSSHTTAQAVLKYLNDHLTEELSLDRLSREFFLSPSYLCRLFKKYTGISINKYVAARRISLATTLMNNGVSPSEVYEQVGFNNYNNFFKTFVDIVGTSPKNYMKYD